MVACHKRDNRRAINVLLIEDDEADFILVESLLKELSSHDNYHLTWAADIDLARSEFAKGFYDIYLLDNSVGSFNGISLLSELVDEGFIDTPVIVLNGSGDHQMDIAAMEAGATDYLDKAKLSADVLGRSIRYCIQQKESERRVQFLAYHDSLTGLANRTLLQEHINRVIPMAKRYHEYGAIVFVDLDDFKVINDTKGHSTGDRLLVVVAERLKAVTRREDIVARLGGDEFVVLLTIHEAELETVAEKAYQTADKVNEVINQVFIIDGEELRVGVSIGVTMIDETSIDAEQVIKYADIAMYRAKNEGKNTIRFFSEDMEEAVQGDLYIANELHTALDNNELELYFQPILDSKRNGSVALEALIRWNHPERGQIPPNLFIPVAEKSHLIIYIGSWVIKTACAYLQRWTGVEYISINISAPHFEKPAFAIEIAEALNQSGIKPNRLVLELTETRLLDHIDQAVHTMKQLRSLGVRLSLDDFGTGFSSLSTLKNLPFNFIKIDRSFVREIGSSGGADALVVAIIAMAKALKLRVIGEGIEEERQRQFLFLHGCDAMQGYYFSKPLSASDFEKKYPQLK